jgi:hypothetical protein
MRGMVFIPRAVWDRVAARWVRFTDLTGVFTDAVMSVKSAHPYCRLVLGASKTTFFTDAVGS